MNLLKILFSLYTISINAMDISNVLISTLESAKERTHLYIGVTNVEHERINDPKALYFSDSSECNTNDEFMKRWGSGNINTIIQLGIWKNIPDLKKDHPYIIGDFNNVETLCTIGKHAKFEKIYIDHSTIKFMQWKFDHFNAIANMLDKGGALIFDKSESDGAAQRLKLISMEIENLLGKPRTTENNLTINQRLDLAEEIEKNKFSNQIKISGLFTFEIKNGGFPFPSNWAKEPYDVVIARRSS